MRSHPLRYVSLVSSVRLGRSTFRPRTAVAAATEEVEVVETVTVAATATAVASGECSRDACDESGPRPNSRARSTHNILAQCVLARVKDVPCVRRLYA